MTHLFELAVRFLQFVAVAVFVGCSRWISAQVVAPVVVTTNVSVRVVAANLTSGNYQRYETPGLNILKALKPDVVAVQEFNYSSSTYGVNTANALREMVDRTFGTNFVYFRETGKNIPNGIISRFPVLASGTWDDPQLSDREFAWAKLDLPGTNDLYIVSVHLYSSGGSGSRATEASVLKTRIQTDFPANAFVIVAGDFNLDSRSETALTTFKTFLSDNPIPDDGRATTSTNQATNANRNKPYDYVLPSFSLSSNLVPVVIGSRTFANGLVFDSRVYTPLSEVSPVQTSDSGVTGMQHMAVVKDFEIPYTTTNFVTVTAPQLSFTPPNFISWQGNSNVNYGIETSSNLVSWLRVTTVGSSNGTFRFTNALSGGSTLFYRVVYP